jgi:hypothetical protein
MARRWIPALVALGLACTATMLQGQRIGTMIEAMPVELETRFALSAAPPRLRDQATVHLLDPATGYRLARRGTNGVTCIVQRTAWELNDFRDDIYIPLCYDAVGTTTYLKVIMDAAALRARGLAPAALKSEIERRFAKETYRVPGRPGVSYMVAPVQRTIGPPDLKVRTLVLPHVMFYAPHLTNEDIGARPDLGDHASLHYPFIDRQGNAEQSYVIQLVGEAEKTAIVSAERALLADLCAYRDVLCLEGRAAQATR